MAHADEDVVCRSKTDDGTTGNDIKLISNADEEPVGGEVMFGNHMKSIPSHGQSILGGRFS